MRKITKLFNTKATSINEVDNTVDFVISDDTIDRYGEVVDQKSWNFLEYLKNPLVLWGHDASEPENVLGTASSLAIAKDGKSTTAQLKFDTAINPKAALVFNQIKAGSLRTVSVGFINHSEETENDVPILKDNDLLEISVVPIPANPNAIALSLKAGAINSKDAKWLMDGMRKEADLLEAQLKEQPNEAGDNNVEELKGQIATLTEAVGKLTETVSAQVDQNAELKAQLEELQKNQPVVETEEEKTAREAQEAKDAEEKAAADKKAADEEAERKAAQETENDDDPAKPGDDDQGGAGEDELDDDAEVTPEVQAKIDAELETAVANQ